jgi:hypothetical protein
MPRRNDISSILFGGAALLFIYEASAQEIRPPAPTYERTIAAIAACGVPAARVRIAYEDELQSDFVYIGDLGGSDEARFRCLRKSIHPAYILDVSAAPQVRAYYEFTRREDAKDARVEAREWLKSAGMLHRVPRYDPRKGLKAFASALEAACSIPSGSALGTYGTSQVTLLRSFTGDFMRTDNHKELDCLFRMISASNAQEHDITMTYIRKAAALEAKR